MNDCVAIWTKCVVCEDQQGKKGLVVARVAILDCSTLICHEHWVKPYLTVVDYREDYTGATKDILESATPFHDIQKLVERLIAGKIIIGHTLWHDLNVLQLCHNERQTRDLALFMPFKCFGKFNHDFKTLISKLSPIYYDKIEHEGPVLQTPKVMALAVFSLFKHLADRHSEILDQPEHFFDLPPERFLYTYNLSQTDFK